MVAPTPHSKTINTTSSGFTNIIFRGNLQRTSSSFPPPIPRQSTKHHHVSPTSYFVAINNERHHTPPPRTPSPHPGFEDNEQNIIMPHQQPSWFKQKLTQTCPWPHDSKRVVSVLAFRSAKTACVSQCIFGIPNKVSVRECAHGDWNGAARTWPPER